jgi:hypothetical protein
MSPLTIVGRRSSLFTRPPLILVEGLGVPYELVPICDMTELGPEVYASNPALELPIMRRRRLHIRIRQVARHVGDRGTDRARNTRRQQRIARV